MGFVDMLVVDSWIKVFYVNGPALKVFPLFWKEARCNILGPHDLFDFMQCFFYCPC